MARTRPLVSATTVAALCALKAGALSRSMSSSTVSALCWMPRSSPVRTTSTRSSPSLPASARPFDLAEGKIEIPVRALLAVVLDRRRRISPRGVDLSLGHEAGVDEIAEHVVGARARRRQIDIRREFGRRLEEAGEHRRLGERDVARGLAEIILRGGLHAERAAAHIGAIEIEARGSASSSDDARARARDRLP